MPARRLRPALLPVVLLAGSACASLQGVAPDPEPLRVATYNVSLNDDSAGGLVRRLEHGDEDARRIAAVIQHLRPDIVLLNEFDYDAGHRAAAIFARDYLARPQSGQAPIEYPHAYLAPVNTGVPSGLDLDGDGRNDGPGDAWGFGLHPGQYGMLLLSRYPIDADAVRSFRELRWSRMPGALAPQDPAGTGPWYAASTWQQLRLSSKSHWDVPVDTPFGRLHVLAAHPTPPVFDGPEDRNGRRNHDEIRLWAEYIGSNTDTWLVDDQGRPGGLPDQASFVILGDYNADPIDGDSVPGAIDQLLAHPRILDYPAPSSRGGVAAALRDGGANLDHRGDPAHDTGAFGPATGNLRVDYVLPSRNARVVGSGVFWPEPGEPGSDWVEASDHRAVWLDLSFDEVAGDRAR